MSARWPPHALVLQLGPGLKGKVDTDKNHHLALKSFSSSNRLVPASGSGQRVLCHCQQVWAPLPQIPQLLVFPSALPALRCFADAGQPTPSGGGVIACSTPRFLSFNTGAPRGPAVPTSINPPCERRERLVRKCSERKSSEFSAQLPAHWMLGDRPVWGLPTSSIH